MVTCAEAIREVLTEIGGVASTSQIISFIYRRYPDKPWKESTIRAHVIGCSVNHSSSHHYPNFPKFLFTVGAGRVRLYDRERDGEWIVDQKGTHVADEETVSEGLATEEESIEATISLERDLETHLLQNLVSLEVGLKPYSDPGTSRQFQVESGRVDILAQDSNEDLVVIEIKTGIAKDSVLTQLLDYMVHVRRDLASAKKVTGIILAHDFTGRLMNAVKEVPSVKLKKFKVNFQFEDA